MPVTQRTLASDPARQHHSDTCGTEDTVSYVNKTNGWDLFPVPRSLAGSIPPLCLAAVLLPETGAQQSDST